LDDWLNEDHLARFVVEVVDQLDLSNLTRQYAERLEGASSGHPAGDPGVWLRYGRLLQP